MSRNYLIWVETHDRWEDCFVISSDESKAVQFHADFEGYDCCIVRATKIIPALCGGKTRHAHRQDIVRAGGVVVFDGESKVIKIEGVESFNIYPLVYRVDEKYFVQGSPLLGVARQISIGRHGRSILLRALGLKRCSVCNFIFELQNFTIDNSKSDGRTSMCCSCSRGSKRRYDHSEKGRASASRSVARERTMRETDEIYAQRRRDIVNRSSSRPEYLKRLSDHRKTDVGKLQKRASDAVQSAIERGVLVRPESCEECHRAPGLDKIGRSKVRAFHHKGYEEKNHLNVKFLCPRCLNRKIAVPRRKAGDR